MRKIPKRLLGEILADPYYAICCHEGCGKQAELEHAIMESGRQLNEKWAIIPCCPGHNRGSLLDKQKNRWYALNQMTEADANKYPKSAPAWLQEKKYLNTIYGYL